MPVGVDNEALKVSRHEIAPGGICSQLSSFRFILDNGADGPTYASLFQKFIAGRHGGVPMRKCTRVTRRNGKW